MFHMLTKQDRKYIDDLFEEKIGVLAIMIQGGFSALETRMDRLETRMDGLDNRMDRLEIRMDGLETRMDNLEGRMNTLEFKLITAPNNRLDRVEDDVRQIKAKIGIV